MEKGKEMKVVQEVNIKDNLQAPIYMGDKIGEVSYSLNDEIINKIDIVAEKTIEKANLWNITTKIFNIWFRVNR